MVKIIPDYRIQVEFSFNLDRSVIKSLIKTINNLIYHNVIWKTINTETTEYGGAKVIEISSKIFTKTIKKALHQYIQSWCTGFGVKCKITEL